jgi:hypothetical protein
MGDTYKWRVHHRRGATCGQFWMSGWQLGDCPETGFWQVREAEWLYIRDPLFSLSIEGHAIGTRREQARQLI